MRVLISIIVSFIILFSGCASRSNQKNVAAPSFKEISAPVGEIHGYSENIHRQAKSVQTTGSQPNDVRVIKIVQESAKQQEAVQVLEKQIKTKEDEIKQQYKEFNTTIGDLNKKIGLLEDDLKKKNLEIKKLKAKKIWFPYGVAALGWLAFILVAARKV